MAIFSLLLVQVDRLLRLLSNTKLNVWETFGTWAQFLIAERKEIIVALDWTDFDADDHAVLAAYHGDLVPGSVYPSLLHPFKP